MTPVNSEVKKRVKLIIVGQGLTVAALARKINRSRQWTSAILYGHAKSEITRRAIARALGKTVAEIWPGKKAA